jgi:hypothetical protein
MYRSPARAIAFVDKRPVRLEIDGSAAEVTLLEAVNGFALRLPGGQHKAKLDFR